MPQDPKATAEGAWGGGSRRAKSLAKRGLRAAAPQRSQARCSSGAPPPVTVAPRSCHRGRAEQASDRDGASGTPIGTTTTVGIPMCVPILATMSSHAGAICVMNTHDQQATGTASERAVQAPIVVHHAADTRAIRDHYRGIALRLLSRAGWACRHEVALAIAPQLPLAAATRRAQRVLGRGAKANLVQARRVDTGEWLYGLTPGGALWLRDRLGISASATTTSLANANRIQHRRIATAIATTGELLGARALHERELYQRAESYRQSFKKLPDCILEWEEGAERYASWHEVDLSHRNARDTRTLHDALSLLASTSGKMTSDARQLVAFVFHVRSGLAARQLRRELARLWSEQDWKGDDFANGVLQCNGFQVLIEPLPPADFWIPRDGLLLPWAYGGAVQLPRQGEWEPSYTERGCVALSGEASDLR